MARLNEEEHKGEALIACGRFMYIQIVSLEAAGAIIVGGVKIFFRHAVGRFNLFTGAE
nr:bifunctional 3-dehydroquinate dehydratase/shikimate dehydrogenase, chloroplastic-like [Tanacetum cinerariifolium]